MKYFVTFERYSSKSDSVSENIRRISGFRSFSGKDRKGDVSMAWIFCV
jgi:hypothetical protein